MAARLSFVNTTQLAKHFHCHGTDFGCIDMHEYEKLADSFMSGSKETHVLECTRIKGDILRYDTNSMFFGVISSTGIVRTFFRPVPCVTLPFHLRGRACHDKATNEDYFSTECKK